MQGLRNTFLYRNICPEQEQACKPGYFRVLSERYIAREYVERWLMWLEHFTTGNSESQSLILVLWKYTYFQSFLIKPGHEYAQVLYVPSHVNKVTVYNIYNAQT